MQARNVFNVSKERPSLLSSLKHHNSLKLNTNNNKEGGLRATQRLPHKCQPLKRLQQEQIQQDADAAVSEAVTEAEEVAEAPEGEAALPVPPETQIIQQKGIQWQPGGLAASARTSTTHPTARCP